MVGIRWTKEEDNILTTNYNSNTGKDKLLGLLPNRSWDAIKIRAEKLKLKFYKGTHPYVRANLAVLLENTCTAHYWNGFLMADGNCNNSSRLVLCLSIKDKEHLINFAKFINCKYTIHKSLTKIYVRVQDKYNMKLLKEKLSWEDVKTYNPPSINVFENMSDDLFLSFFIGFIDGDGHIRKQYNRQDSCIVLKLHSSWLNILTYFSKRLCTLLNINNKVAKINSKGYAFIVFSNSKIVNYLKNETNRLGLPVLQRKWDVIDEKFVSKRILDSNNRNSVINMLKEGYSSIEICNTLNVSNSLITKITKDMGYNGLKDFRKQQLGKEGVS